MTRIRLVWLGLAAVAAALSIWLSVPFWIAAAAFGCAVVPLLVGAFMRSSAPALRVAEIEASLWIALATMSVASTGGIGSPLIVLFGVGVATAWISGRPRATIEAAGFSFLGLAAAALASMNGSWLEENVAQILAMIYGACALGLLAVMAVVEVTGRKAKEPARPAPSLPEGRQPDAQLAWRLKQLEAKARMAEAAEQAARKEAEAAEKKLEARTTFFAQTSHELRTPLNAILGFAEMMRNAVFGPLPERYQEYAGLIHEGGRNLSLIVDDVLDLAKVEAGRFEIFRDLISLTDLAAEAVHFMKDEAARKGVTLTLADGEDVDAFADTKAVRQIALNLISNALKFTPKGGSVVVSATQTPDGGALLAVSDTGVGISPEELNKLSRIFEQGEAGRHQKGTGLGLSVVRAFAELHGGRLDIESRPGGGATIAVFFPPESGAG